MAIVLRKPGTVYKEEMPELGLTITCKAIDAQAAALIQKLATKFVRYLQGEYKDKDGNEIDFDFVDYFETIIGFCAEKIEGLEFEGQPFELRKESDGKLTHEFLNILFPVAGRITDFLVGKINLTKQDIKNS